MFSKEELIADGLTEDESELFLTTVALADTVEMLPDDIESFIRAYEQRIPEDAIEGMREVFALAQSDPEFLRKIVSLDLVLAHGIEEQPPKPAEKTIITELPKNEYERVSKNFFKILANLSDSDRKEFFKLIINLTEEQKKDMVARLNR